MKTLRSVVGACAILAALPALAHAQSYATDRGSMLVGGTASFSSSGTRSNGGPWNRTTRLDLAPRVQYFILPGLAVGGDLSFSRAFGDVTTTHYGAGPTVSYYFGRAERAWYPYLRARVGLYRVVYGDEAQPSQTSRGYAASGGVLLMLSRAVGLDAALTYEMPSDDQPDFRTLAFGLGISAFVF